MPFEVGKAINDTANYFLNAPFLRKAAGNPIYSAMLITFAIVLVALVVFRDAETEDSMALHLAKLGFWTFIPVLGIMFLHNTILIRESDTRTKNAAYEDVVNATATIVPGSALADAIAGTTVVPNFAL